MTGAIMKRVCALILFLPLAHACASRQSNERPSATEPVRGMQHMEARMQNMQGLMDRIHGTEDPQERQRLMREHMQSMQESMTTMRRMMHEQRDEQTGQPPQSDADEAVPDETERHEEHH
jgi:hypothetical protein